METVLLGGSEISVSRLAYGCWRIATAGEAAADWATACAALDAALEAGYTLFDHADIYCKGRAEEVFGRWLGERRGVRERIVVATKCGIRPGFYDFSAGWILGQVEQSLRRMGVERIDLLQLHRPDLLMNAAEVAEAFDRLHRQGKVREFGVSNFAPSQVSLLQAAVGRPLVCNQVEISLAQLERLCDGTLDQCQERNMTPMAWSPLGAGLLGSGGKDLLPGQRGYKVEGINAMLDAAGTEYGIGRSGAALAWLLRHPSRIVPIIGSVQPGRIRQATAAAGISISRETWYELYTAARGVPLA